MGHEKKYTKTERRGLPGGPNEMFTYVTGVFSSSPGFYKAESSIEGQGLFADKTFSPGDLIGLAHEDGVPVTELGKFHNHNENDPNMSSRLIGNQRYVFANKDIKPGDELTTNYRLQPELEQPEDFLAKAQDGNGENIIRPRGDSYEYKREGDKFYTRKREGEWESEEQPDWTLASGDVAAAIQQKVYGEEQPKSLLQELTEGVGSFYKELVSERAEQKEALQKIDTSGYGIRVIQYPYGHDGMESGHIEAVLYDKDTDEIVNKIPDTDFIGYINRWPNDGNREVTESKYKDDESVRVVDLALPEEAVRDFIGNAQNFLPSKRDQVHTNLGISNKNRLPISAGNNPRRYDFLESNCATGICIGLNMDPDSPVNQTGGITDPNEVMDNILTTFSNYYDAEEDVKGDRTSRREGITKLVTERLGIKPNSRVLSIAVDYLDGLGRNELTDALEDLSKKPIVQRLAKGESFMSPLGIGQTASEISDAFGELPDGTMSALLGMAWEQGPNAYIRENTPFDFSSEGVDNIVPWWQRNVISPVGDAVGDALENAGKSVSNFFGLRSHGGEEGHSPKSIIEVDKDIEIPYDESLQYKFKPKLDKTKFSINTDFKKKFGTKFHTVLPTDTQIDFKTTLPLNIFSSVLPFDLPDYNKSKIDLSLKQPINDDTTVGFDINAAIRDGKTQLTPQLTLKHSFKKGGSVSWMWKGKKYYGTLIPSMEDEKNRYARTKNGKIKKLPKKQEGGPMSRAERIYNLIPPTGYNDIGNIFNYFKVDSDSPVPVRTEMTDPRGEEMYKQYLGINTTPKYLRPSSSKPSISKDKNVQYYQLDPELEKSIFGAVGNTLKVGDIKQMGELDLPERFNVDDNYGGYNMWSGLGNFTVSKGVDDEGKEYISYYDKYDLPDYIQDRLKGQPYEVYGRINPNMVREFQGSEIQDEKDYDALYGEGAYREQFLEKVNPQHLVSGTTDILNKQRLFREDMKKGVSLKKSQRGGTVSELWEEVTGTPWSQAKAQGLTDGGYDANIQLRNQLIQSPSKFKQRPSNTLPPANTNSNAANATLSPEEINDKINRAKDFNSAFGIARDYYGANKIFEYNGKQYGTNLAGETFEPSEEDMVAAGLKPKQRDKIYKQNRSVVSPYTDDNIVEFDEYEDFENIKKNNANLNRMDQADLIVSYQLANAKKPYLIVDEQMGRMHLYYPGEEQPVESYPILSGSNAGDAQTVTKADYFYNGKKLDQQGLNDAMTATGASSVDALMDMPGYSAKTNWSAGNKTTGAGKFTIGTINEDSGFYDDSGQNRKTPSFVLKNEDGNEVSTVIHTVPSSMSAARINALTAQDPANMRMTNGCINGMCSDLIEMHNIHDIGEGSEIFILPEDQGNKFVYENGKLNFRTTFQNRVDAESYVDAEGNVQRGQGINRSRNTLNYRPIKIDIDKETFENDKFTYFDFDDEQEYNTVVVPFVKSLEDNKQKIMKTMQVTGDVYNDIAKISLGILGNETNFGDTHSEFGNILRGASKVMNEARSSSPDYQFKYQPSIQLGNEKVPVTGGLVPERFTGAKSDDNSVGLTQFRWKWVEKDPELKKRLKTLGITSNVDFMDAEKAALGTAAVLAYYYNNRKVDDIYRDLPKHWAGSIKRDPDRKVYADNVMNNIKYFTLKEKTTFQGGGGVGQDILLRQAYAESTFRPKVTSKANAKGLTQIRPNVLSDYKKANNIEGDVDLTNVSDAVDVQKWYMNDLYNASFIDKENQSEDVRLAKTLAAYNWGRGNLLNFLNEEKESSDIYKSLDWVEKLPNETKTYINKILGNNDQFNEDYNKAVNNEKYTYIVNEYKSIGGEISDLKIYKDYVNGLYDGKPNLKKAERIYDKLNRVYYYKAGQVGMSAPNYIMSYLD